MNKAVLVIDVQRAFFDVDPPPSDAGNVIDRINAVTEAARAAGAPVIFVQHEGPSGSLTYASESWQLERRLIVVAGDTVIRKTTPDSFLRTELGEVLARWRIEELVICGYATEFCVDTTVRRAAALGYPVTLVADAHTTDDKEHASAANIRAHHNATLPNITSFGPTIAAALSRDVVFRTRY